MKQRVLFVDDDPNILNAFRRQLRKKFDVQYAEGGAKAISMLKNDGPFALVISDMQMPEVTGLDVLTHATEQSPDTVRIMLTGNADQKTAVDAVNHGKIFRFLSKPCEIDVLIPSIEAGLEQHRLRNAERQLLAETLNGSIDLLNDVLGTTNPIAFGRANRLRSMVNVLSESIPEASRWQLGVAAGLSQIGWVTIPSEVIEKRSRGQELTESEMAMVCDVPRLSAQFVSRIPRLEKIGQIIELQPKLSDPESPVDSDSDDVTTCAKLLDLVLAFDEYAERLPRAEAMEEVSRIDRFSEETELLEKLKLVSDESSTLLSINLDKLKIGMILDQDIVTTSGLLVVPEGQVITDSLLVRLGNYDENQGVAQPIRVRVV